MTIKESLGGGVVPGGVCVIVGVEYFETKKKEGL